MQIAAAAERSFKRFPWNMNLLFGEWELLRHICMCDYQALKIFTFFSFCSHALLQTIAAAKITEANKCKRCCSTIYWIIIPCLFLSLSAECTQYRNQTMTLECVRTTAKNVLGCSLIAARFKHVKNIFIVTKNK